MAGEIPFIEPITTQLAKLKSRDEWEVWYEANYGHMTLEEYLVQSSIKER